MNGAKEDMKVFGVRKEERRALHGDRRFAVAPPTGRKPEGKEEVDWYFIAIVIVFLLIPILFPFLSYIYGEPLGQLKLL